MKDKSDSAVHLEMRKKKKITHSVEYLASENILPAQKIVNKQRKNIIAKNKKTHMIGPVKKIMWFGVGVTRLHDVLKKYCSNVH